MEGALEIEADEPSACVANKRWNWGEVFVGNRRRRESRGIETIEVYH
jgi:hypothetical protein